MKIIAKRYHEQILRFGIISIALFAFIILSIRCAEPLDKQVDLQEQYVLNEESPIVVLPNSEIQIQFIEVFDDNQCRKGLLCDMSGKGKVMIGITGPGLMPFPTELTIGITSNALFGYSVILDTIDRTESLDAVTVTITKNQSE